MGQNRYSKEEEIFAMNLKIFLYILGITVTGTLSLPNQFQSFFDSSSMQAPRISGGHEVIPHSLPYQAALYVDHEFCGGTLLNSLFVLTSAQCVLGKSNITVVLGAHNLDNLEDTRQIIPARTVIIHEYFNEKTKENDIALIRLVIPARYTEFVQPIQIIDVNDGVQIIGLPGYISGWGYTQRNSTSLSSVLREASATILGNEECAMLFREKIPSTALCVSGGHLAGACHGDYGGPVALHLLPYPIQVGITFYSELEACESGKPTVFTNLPLFFEWIRKHTIPLH